MRIEVIIHKLGMKEGLSVLGDSITDWPYSSPQPTSVEYSQWEQEYDTYLKIVEIKKKAGEVILTRLPEWKQRNLLSEASLILADTTLSPDAKESALSDYKAYLAWAKTVRMHSNYLETEVLKGNSVDVNSGWPGWPPKGLSGEVVV